MSSSTLVICICVAAVALVVGVSPTHGVEVTGRNLLAGPRSLEWVKTNLLARDAGMLYPPAADRASWEALAVDVRAAHVKRGEELLDQRWESLPATLFLEFARDGNRSRYERAQFSRRGQLRDLTLAECVEGKGRFVDQIVNGIWLTCEETYWGIPAHVGAQRAGRGLPDVAEPTIDLFAAETAAKLAWTVHLLRPQLDKVSPLIRQRVAAEIERRILTPYLERDQDWWMGFGPRKDLNNWTPWIVSNVLTCALLSEPNSDRRAELVHRSLRILDNFINIYPADGGCDEGPSYWGRAAGSLFDCLELLHTATGGRLDIYGEPLIKDMARFVHRVHIGGDWYVNFGDASARASVDGPMVYRFGRRIDDAETTAFGAWLMSQPKPPQTSSAARSLGRILPELFDAGSDVDRAEPRPPLARDVWLRDSQIMVARDRAGSNDGLLLAVMGAHNAQQHNHNDVGNFVVAVNGRPMLIDVGVETYTAKTFSNRRYEIWTMQSAYHNLPTINGAMQSDGQQFAARDVVYRCDDESAEISMDLAGAYPAEAQVDRWNRRMRLIRGREIELVETYSLRTVTKPLVLNLMSACDVDSTTAGRLVLSGGELPAAADNPGLTILYDSAALRAAVEPITIEDGRLKPVWGEKLYRIQLTAEKPAARGEFVLKLQARSQPAPNR